jgi:hypothetical protein
VEKQIMSGFNWLRWLSNPASGLARPRSRSTSSRQSSGSTEPLEQRALLSATGLVPQVGPDGSSIDIGAPDDEEVNDPTDETPSGDDSQFDIYESDTAQLDDDFETFAASSNTETVTYGPVYLPGFVLNPDELWIMTLVDHRNIAPVSSDPNLTNNRDPISAPDSSPPDDSLPIQDADFTFSLPEKSNPATWVGTITDGILSANPDVTYAITGGNESGAFSIDSATGKISVANETPLDFLSHPHFGLTVQITNHSDPGLSGTVSVAVNLTNVNEAPILNDTSFSIPENTPNSTVVGTVYASDPDVGSALHYAITGGNGAAAFAIDPYTGKVTVADKSLLDYEARDTFYLTTTVTDNGSPQLSTTAKLTIHLINVDDPPVISFPPKTIRYTQGSSAVRFGRDAAVSDEDNPVPVFTDLVLTVSITENRSNKDVLAIKDTGEKSKKIVVHGSNVLYGKTVIGVVEGGKETEPTLKITLNSAASQTSVDALLRALSFSTKDTSTVPRTMDVNIESHDGEVLSSTERYVQLKKQPKAKLPGILGYLIK